MGDKSYPNTGAGADKQYAGGEALRSVDKFMKGHMQGGVYEHVSAV
jgi:hypothetical protein